MHHNRSVPRMVGAYVHAFPRRSQRERPEETALSLEREDLGREPSSLFLHRAQRASHPLSLSSLAREQASETASRSARELAGRGAGSTPLRSLALSPTSLLPLSSSRALPSLSLSPSPLSLSLINSFKLISINIIFISLKNSTSAVDKIVKQINFPVFIHSVRFCAAKHPWQPLSMLAYNNSHSMWIIWMILIAQPFKTR